MCKRDNIKALPLSSFDRVLRKIFPDVTVSPPGAKKTRMYLGLHVRQHSEEQKRLQQHRQSQIRKRQRLAEADDSDGEEASTTQTLSTSALRFLSDLLTRERQRATEDFLTGNHTPSTSSANNIATSRPSSPPLYGPLPTEWLGGFIRWEDEGRESDDEIPHSISLSDDDKLSGDTLGQTSHLLDLMLNQELFD